MRASKKVLVAITCVIMALSVTLVGCGSPAATPSATPEVKLVKDGVLTVGSDCDYPPFIEMQGANPAGFEYEMMEAVAKELNLKLEYLAPQNFDSILASVASGTKMDVGVSSLTITDERKELIDFCIPYFDSNQACVALKSKNFTSPMDLNGKTVGAQSGTTGADWVNENLKDPGTTLKEYNQTSEALAAMMAGDIEAVFYDEPVAKLQITTTYTEAEIVQVIATGEQYGIAVAKTNTALREEINKALQALKANGTFDTIFSKYFPDDIKPPKLTN
jgi:polar amino acid transport system substrate-binding protein